MPIRTIIRRLGHLRIFANTKIECSWSCARHLLRLRIKVDGQSSSPKQDTLRGLKEDFTYHSFSCLCFLLPSAKRSRSKNAKGHPIRIRLKHVTCYSDTFNKASNGTRISSFHESSLLNPSGTNKTTFRELWFWLCCYQNSPMIGRSLEDIWQ